jgi:hypothetical protein
MGDGLTLPIVSTVGSLLDAETTLHEPAVYIYNEAIVSLITVVSDDGDSLKSRRNLFHPHTADYPRKFHCRYVLIKYPHLTYCGWSTSNVEWQND